MDSEEEIHPILAFILKEGQSELNLIPTWRNKTYKIQIVLTENVLYFGLAFRVEEQCNIALFFLIEETSFYADGIPCFTRFLWLLSLMTFCLYRVDKSPQGRGNGEFRSRRCIFCRSLGRVGGGPWLVKGYSPLNKKLRFSRHFWSYSYQWMLFFVVLFIYCIWK